MDEATREQPEAENAATELLPPVAVATERLASPERLPLVARPFSRGLTTLLLVGALTLTALAYSADLALAHEDWSAGATVAGQGGPWRGPPALPAALPPPARWRTPGGAPL